MLGNTEELLVRPLFYDVLNGEFKLPSDSEEHLHTLGRLAYETFIKGTVCTNEALPYRTFYDYQPLWAAGVNVHIGADAPHAKLSHINLTAEANNARLYIQDVGTATTPQLYIVSNVLRQGRTHSVALGADLTAAREQVTEAAQVFFESAG